MTDLASHASNPFLNDQAREGLMQEYEGLRNDSLLVRKETFMGKNLFDDMAAKHFPPVNYGDGFTDKGTGEYQLQQGPLSPKPSGYNNDAKYYEVEREVYFDRGKFSLEVNGGNTGERYILKQGEHIIFDTAGNNQLVVLAMQSGLLKEQLINMILTNLKSNMPQGSQQPSSSFHNQQGTLLILQGIILSVMG